MVFLWPPPKRRTVINLVIPSSSLKVYPTLREKTEFIGRVARAAAAGRATNIIILNDEGAKGEEGLNLFTLVLSYLTVAPYLRKRIIPITPELRYAGALPPLSLATHNPGGEPPKKGALRDGVVTRSWGLKANVFIGYRRKCFTKSVKTLSPGERVLVRVVEEEPLRCVEEDPDSVPEYVGYKVYPVPRVRLLRKALRDIGIGLGVLTTKEGQEFDSKLGNHLRKEVSGFEKLTLLFGNAEQDFHEIVGEELIQNLGVRYRINFIPRQGLLSIRVDEALNSVLSILNIYIP